VRHRLPINGARRPGRCTWPAGIPQEGIECRRSSAIVQSPSVLLNREARNSSIGEAVKAKDDIRDIIALDCMVARTQRKPAAEFVDDGVVCALHLISWQRNLVRPFAVNRGRGQLTLSSCHLQAQSKSSGTLPNVLRIAGSPNLPTRGLSIRANATAPAFASLRDIASACRITADRCGHSTASPGAGPPFSRRTNGNAA